jgi:DNA repair exonuclease SbcCD ATPase subunit
MRLKKISWRNFKSYSNVLTELDFENKSSLNLIVGGNGTGKSSISEVITYSLYGKIENFKAAEIPNRINKNFWSKIELDCDGHEVIVTRGLAPSVFEATIDGNVIDTAGKTNVQTMLEEVYFKIPYSVFINTLVLSINDFKSLVDLNASDKRNIIDKIFGFTVYNQLTKIVKEEQKALLYDISSNEGSIRTSSSHISDYDKQIEEIKENVSSKEELDALVKKINDAKESKKKNEEIMSKLSDMRAQLHNTTVDETVAYKDNVHKLEVIDKRIKLIESGKCPECGTSLIGEQFDKEKEELMEERKVYITNMENIKTSLKGIKSKMNAIEKKENNVRTTLNRSRLVDLQSEYKYKTSIKESNIDPLLKLKSELNDELVELNTERENLENDKKVLEVILTILGENGIKKYIASQYVPVINKIMSDVLQFMNLNYIVTFDNNFNSTITSNGYNVNYNTLSTGEKKRIDFASVISIIKFLKLQLGELNLLFLDELFSNIDVNGVSDMVNLLKQLSDELEINIYLIHHAKLEGVAFDTIIRTIKPDGFSRMEIEKGDA